MCDGDADLQELWGLAPADTLSVIQMFASVSMLVPVTSPQGPRWHVANLAQVRPGPRSQPCAGHVPTRLGLVAAGRATHDPLLLYCLDRGFSRACASALCGIARGCALLPKCVQLLCGG